MEVDQIAPTSAAGLTPQSHYRTALIALLTFSIAIGSAVGFRFVASPTMSTTLWKLSWLPVCLAALRLTYGLRLRDAATELGLSVELRGLGIGFVMTLPMALVLLTSLPVNDRMTAGALISTAVLAPVTEEVLFRGYLFRQLYARAGWPFLPAVVTTAFLFGLAHLPAVWGHSGRDAIVGEIGSIAIGGVFFSWLFVRWSYDLWIPIAVHGFINLWCEMVSCDEALGSGATLVGRVLTVVAACGLTMVIRRKKRTRAS